MKLFADVSSLAASHLTVGQLTGVKGVGDYLIKASGTGITLANGKIAVPQASGTAISVKQFGAVGDGVADDTAAIQAAIDSAGSSSVFLPAGTYLTTNTLQLGGYTKLIGETGSSGTFAGHVSKIYYQKTLTKTTLNGAIGTGDTTITLTDASAFPTSGIFYIDTINGEYVKYTGKSGNDLTGCTRGYYGGEVGATAYAGTESVTLLEPALMRDPSSFSGTLQGLEIRCDNFISEATGWDDLGVGVYIAYGAYARIIDHTLLYGFEKGLYTGQSYVTKLDNPMAYRCRYGIHVDGGNAATAVNSDFGTIGYAAGPTAGWCYKLNGCNGMTISGGNIGNGGLHTNVKVDNSDNVSIIGCYSESSAQNYIIAENSSQVCVDNCYIKGCTYLGEPKTSSFISIKNSSVQNVTNMVGNPSDTTGLWEIENVYDIDGAAFLDNLIGKDGLYYTSPHFTKVSSVERLTPLFHSVSVPDSTATDIFNIRMDVNTSLDAWAGFRVSYMFKGGYSSGYASEKGTLEIMVQLRSTVAPTYNVVEIGSSQATFAGVTLATTFAMTHTLVSTNRYDIKLQLTAVSSNAATGTLDVIIEPMDIAANSSDPRYGQVTLL